MMSSHGKRRSPLAVMKDSVLRPRPRGSPETSLNAYQLLATEMFESSEQPALDFPSRTRRVSASKVWRSLSRRPSGPTRASTCASPTTREERLLEAESDDRHRRLSSLDSATTKVVLERVMSQKESPLTSGRLSHDSEALKIASSKANSPPLSPSDELEDDLVKSFRAKKALRPLITSSANCLPTTHSSLLNTPVSGARTVGRWLKDRREKKKEEARVHNAQLHAAVSVASVAAAVAAITAATAAASSSAGTTNEETAKMDMAVASAATLVAAQCAEAAEAMGADREHLASAVSSAVNVRMHDDVTTLTAAAATALRGAATLKARVKRDERNSATVMPADRGIDIGLGTGDATGNSPSCSSGEIIAEDWFPNVRIQDYLANGTELLKRTRKGNLHRKIVTAYINRAGQVILRMKSRHIAGTVMKMDENVVIDVCKDTPARSGRRLFDGAGQRHYFGMKTATQGGIQFDCRDRQEHEIWTHGISRLLSAAARRKRLSSCWTCSQEFAVG